MNAGWNGGVAMAVGAAFAMLLSGAAAAVTMKGVEIVGTDLRVELSDGRTLSGKTLVGAVLGLRNEEGAASPSRSRT